MIEHNNVDAKRAGLNVGLTVNQGIGKLMYDWKGLVIAHSNTMKKVLLYTTV